MSSNSSQPALETLPPGLFDDTLGLLFIGFVVTTILYGNSMVQTFIYTTCARSALDHIFTKLFVFVLFLSDTIIQLLLTWAMYRLLITDFGNPEGLLTRGPTTGPHLLNASGIPNTFVSLIVQLFFVHRIWGFSLSIRSPLKWAFTVLTICLSLLNFASSLAIVINSLIDSAAPRPNPLLWRLGLTSSVACDMSLAICLCIILMRERTSKPSGANTTLNYLMMMSISTGLMTTAVTIASLVTYFASTTTTCYLALQFVSNRLYINSALAALNSRQALRRILVRGADAENVSVPNFRTHNTVTTSDGLLSHSHSHTGQDSERKSLKEQEASMQAQPPQSWSERDS